MTFNKPNLSLLIKTLYENLTQDMSTLLGIDSKIRFISDQDIVREQEGKIAFSEVSENTNTLKEVCIIKVPPYQNDEAETDGFIAEDQETNMVWFLDKWDSSATKAFTKVGLYNSKNSAVDGIIFHYNTTKKGKKYLYIYLIELKSSIEHQEEDDSKGKDANQTLVGIQAKIEQSISKLVFLVPIIAHANDIDFDDTTIQFKAVIFFNNRGSFKEEDIQPEYQELYKAYTAKKGKLVELKQTILGGDKIRVRFIHFQDEDVEKESNNQRIVIDFNKMIKF